MTKMNRSDDLRDTPSSSCFGQSSLLVHKLSQFSKRSVLHNKTEMRGRIDDVVYSNDVGMSKVAQSLHLSKKSICVFQITDAPFGDELYGNNLFRFQMFSFEDFSKTASSD
eukprot:GDKK01052655.1.p2 GENE.GDKK01052655.1~~GDKK01052655.1.p2  ORF type:complete len:111 (-),score=12.88 GDKK01052655.1:361-693(-)